MESIQIADAVPFVISIFKYIFLILGGFNVLPNDGLVFISSNQQAQYDLLPQNELKVLCSLLGNMFYSFYHRYNNKYCIFSIVLLFR
jgi:hypothetical protein